MKLIGAGLPPTATTTQKVALEMREMPCYHMRDLMVSMNWTGRGAFAGSYSDRESMIAGMERWNDEVRATVPADRLLEWHPKDGWEPLCELVGADVPSEPMPNVNDTQAFKDGIMGGAITALNEWWEQDQAARAT